MMNENNNVTLSGFIEDELIFSHEIYGEKFYTTKISVGRLSNTFDHIPLMISERCMRTLPIVGDYYKVKGRFSSFNKKENDKSKLVLFVFVQEIEPSEENKFVNNIALDGFLCKKPNYRKTPFSREISDVLLAVNRKYQHTDYIPLIFWGIIARWISHQEIGEELKITGRIQSREYTKSYNDGTSEVKTAYEVSVSRVELVEVVDA